MVKWQIKCTDKSTGTYCVCVCVCDILFENSFWQVALSVISVSITCMCS